MSCRDDRVATSPHRFFQVFCAAHILSFRFLLRSAETWLYFGAIFPWRFPAIALEFSLPGGECPRYAWKNVENFFLQEFPATAKVYIF